MSFNISTAVVLLSVALMIQSCGDTAKKPDVNAKYVIPDTLLRKLTIDTVKKCPLINAVTLTGMVDFDQNNQVNIYSLVSGNIQDIKVELGDYVTEGQVLGVVKSSEMAAYNNTLVQAETNVTLTKKQLEAQKDLYASGLASNLDVTSAQANYDQALSSLETAKKILKINGDNTSGEYVIKSPISGFVVQKNVTNNTAVRSDNGGNLFTISDLKDVWVQANVYEADIEKVHIGDKVEVRTLASPDRIFIGQVDQMLNVLDPSSKVIKVRIVLKNPDYILKPQMYASVVVSSPGDKESLCVSSKALVYENSKYYVVLYEGKGNVDIRPVDVLNTLGNVTYLNSGVQPGDRVIASEALQIYGELNF